jgi:hypothetical protein
MGKKHKFVDRLLCCQYLYSYDANDLPKAINHKLFKNSLQMEMHFELLEEKNPLMIIVHNLMSSALFFKVIRFLNSNKFT